MKAHEFRLRRGRPVAGPTLPTWVWGENAIEDAAGELLKLPQPLLLIGEAKLLQPLRKRLSQAWLEAGVELAIADFPEGAECCQSQLERLLKTIESKKAASLIGFGGGKCLDTVKWAGFKAGLPVACLPGSAATCACATAVAVIHNEKGAVLDVLDLPGPPRLCIADLQILKAAPSRLLAAGVADTLAKWLEWSVIEKDPEGSEAAKQAFELLSRGPAGDGEAALDACLRLSAQASLVGLAPAAAAHSFCAGISILERSRLLLHGEWAGLGLVLQAWLLERLGGPSQDPEPLLKLWGLPTRLPFKLEPAERSAVARRMLEPQESIHSIDFSTPLSLQILEEGLLALEP